MIIWLITLWNDYIRGLSNTNLFLGIALGFAEFALESVFLLAYLAKI